ncbi:MAG TPA: hypothetical protein VFZ73_14300 [Gemmatimonadaceae bacterium]
MMTDNLLSRVFRATLLLALTVSPASAQWTTLNEQYYLPTSHNWVFRDQHPVADRLFNAFDYGHAILYEVLWARPGAPPAVLEQRQYDFITRHLLVNPPGLPLEEAAIAPSYTRLVPEAKLMFEWAHVLHRQIYDVLADNRLNEQQRDREVGRLVEYYRSRPDLAFSTKPKSMTLMEGQPYSLAFRRQYPKFNGLIWGYHWLQVGLYDALLAGRTPDERSALITAAVARFRQMLTNPPQSLPYVMPMTPGVAPLFTERYPEAAAIFDNLHSMHDVISDILANESVPRNQKRAVILAAAAAYRDDTTQVITREEWLGMATAMGIENQGGPVVGVLAEPPRPTVELGAVMRHAPAGAGEHAGHQMPADTVARVADSLSKGVADSAARRQLVDALFRLLGDAEVQRRVAADSGLRRALLDLVPLIPEEHRDHYRMMIRPPPAPPKPAERD